MVEKTGTVYVRNNNGHFVMETKQKSQRIVKEIRRIIVVINEKKKKDKMFGSHYKANQI
jgi:hypothetical protein